MLSQPLSRPCGGQPREGLQMNHQARQHHDAMTGNTRRPTLSFSYRDSHQSLAEVITLQHANERSGRLLQPVDDVLAIFETTRPHPLTDIAQEISLPRGEIRDDEATHEEALAQHRKHVRPGHRGRRIVLRDKPADRNARKIVEQRPHHLLHDAADVLEINVNALRTRGFEQFCKIGRAMVDTSIETQLAKRHFSVPPAIPTAWHPLILTICPTTDPTAPEAAATTTVSPGFG